MEYSTPKTRFFGPWPAFILIILTAAAIYSNIYQSPFVLDTISKIENDLEIRDLTNYSSFDQLLQPRAIVDFTFALNYKFGKLNVFGYHIVNVLIHILNGILAYSLALTIFDRIFRFSQSSKSRHPQSLNSSIPFMALLAALIFVAHPIQTKAVTYIVQRYTSMAALFYMASVLFYLRARRIQRGTGGKRQRSEIRNQRSGPWPAGSPMTSIICLWQSRVIPL